MDTPFNDQMSYEILAYLAEHPDAQDTLEGIVEWWLLERRIINQTVAVKKILSGLVERGLLVERSGRDARSHYRVNPRKAKEIKQLLKQRAG
jgi:hypothetical protein